MLIDSSMYFVEEPINMYNIAFQITCILIACIQIACIYIYIYNIKTYIACIL